MASAQTSFRIRERAQDEGEVQGPKIVAPGGWVKVNFGAKEYTGVVKNILGEHEIPRIEKNKNRLYKPIIDVVALPPVTEKEITLWETIAKYYLCTVGEVFKAAYPISGIRQMTIKSRRNAEGLMKRIAEQNRDKTISLSEKQTVAKKEISEKIKSKPVLLHSCPGGSTIEIYIALAQECIKNGKNVLYLVPEISVGKELQERLKEYFGARLLVFHSGQTEASRKLVRDALQYYPKSQTNRSSGDEELSPQALIILGTRSAILLPYTNLGLIIIDDEHDGTYKQEEPAPRYNGRDSAMFLARLHNAKVLMGSATPSLETLYNCTTGKFSVVKLTENLSCPPSPQVKIIDTSWTRHSHQMKGEFSQELLNTIDKTLSEGGQALLFLNIRSYAPAVECPECGELLRCPHCNIPLSYHKYDNTLRCHYCEYVLPYTGRCVHCGTELKLKGAGVERVEEQLRELRPMYNIARYDADIAGQKRLSEKILKDFHEGKIQILLGTQMLGRERGFKNLPLIALLRAETILSIPDFRADEKAFQLISRLLGLIGSKGKLLIQSDTKKHPVLLAVKEMAEEHRDSITNQCGWGSKKAMEERERFHFPPYVRMVNIIIHHKNSVKVAEIAKELATLFKFSKSIKATEITGPYTLRLRGRKEEHALGFTIKFARDAHLSAGKEALRRAIESLGEHQNIIIDVDPV